MAKSKIQYTILAGQTTSGLGGKLFTFDKNGICEIDDEEALKYFLSIRGVKLIQSEEDVEKVKEQIHHDRKPGEPVILARPLADGKEADDFVRNRHDVVDKKELEIPKVEPPKQKDVEKKADEYDATMGKPKKPRKEKK